MSFAAKARTTIGEALASTSAKLSIAVVLGLAVLPLLPHDAASTSRMAAPATAAPPIELVQAKPVPIIDAPQADPAFQLVARRSRRERQSEEKRSDPANKTSAISREAPAEPPPPPPVAAAKPPVTGGKTSAISPAEPPAAAPLPPSDTAQAEPPKPDVWSDAEVMAALRECVKVLAPIAAEVEVSPPVKSDQCGAPAAVMLRRIGSGANRVDINPPAMLNCAMVAGLHAWVEKVLQPAAQASFGSPIARLRSASGYTCRNRVGSRSHVNADKLSEHARANAIDISGFVTADGRTVEVARFWGPTARDRRDSAKTAAAPARDAKPEAVKPEPAKAQANHRISAISGLAAEPAKAQDRSAQRTAELSRLGRGTSDISADPKAIPAPPVKEAEDVSKSKEAMFLRDLHKGACGVFGTVLGPEANGAHRDHFHFDLAARRRSAFCE